MDSLYKNLCVHTITTKPWSIEECCKNFSKAGIGGISVWRNTLEGRDIKATGRMLQDHSLQIVSLVRGGFFPALEESKRQFSIDDNLRAIDEATSLGAPLIVLVCGADPRQSLEESRDQIREGLVKILPYAESCNVKLAIEPLHPMYAGDRSAINTMKQATNLALELSSEFIGVAVDVYHVWWDPDLESEIKRCGQNNKLFAYHICDWKSDLKDVLNDRGLMGEGCIPIKQISDWVRATGFHGLEEVEIFSNYYWAMDQHVFLENIKSSYLKIYK